jgi:hypothetical protein
MRDAVITEKENALAGFVLMYMGAQTLLGRLCEEEPPAGTTQPGQLYLEPVYVYRVGEESKVDPVTHERVVRAVRSLHPLFGFPEIQRMDVPSGVGVSVSELSQESRDALLQLVSDYEEKRNAMGLVRLATRQDIRRAMR